jgi:hypothetical protein
VITYGKFWEPTLEVEPWAYIDPVIYAFLGWRIYRGSLVAVTLACGFLAISVYFTLQETGRIGGIMLILMAAMLINGVRGTFASDS